MRMRNIDGSDFQNFMADIGPKIKNRDILPDDVKKLLAEIDESDAFMEELRGESSSKIIPFLFGKPRKPKKADGGIISEGFKDGGAASINKATLEGIRDMPMRSRAQRIPYVQKMKSDLEKYMREGGMGSLFKEK